MLRMYFSAVYRLFFVNPSNSLSVKVNRVGLILGLRYWNLKRIACFFEVIRKLEKYQKLSSYWWGGGGGVARGYRRASLTSRFKISKIQAHFGDR